MEYSPELIGERIKKERKRMNWSQQELLVKLHRDKSYRTAMKWEKGDVLPTLDDMFAMCRLFNCELGYLLGEFPEHTRAATDICDITGLTAAAVDHLENWRNMRRDNIDSDWLAANPEDLETCTHAETVLWFIDELFYHTPYIEQIAEYAKSFQQSLGKGVEELKRFIADSEQVSADINHVTGMPNNVQLKADIDNVLMYEYKAKELLGGLIEKLARAKKSELLELQQEFKDVCEARSSRWLT